MRTRAAELAQIEQFLSANGATKIPSRYLAPTSTDFSPTEEALRLQHVRVKALNKAAIRAAAHGFFLTCVHPQGKR
jgi:hypothetical protein